MLTSDVSCPDRRCVLAAAAAGATALLAGCSTYGDKSAAPVAPAPSTAAAAPSGSAAGAGGAAAAGGAGSQGLAALTDVPVGGGTVLADAKIVLTQPVAGTVKAFSAVCTHAGCAVNQVSGGTINCPCHGSKYAIADGSVVAGPAPRPLPPIAVTVQNGQIVRSS